MFGYMRPVSSELRVKEHSLYKAIYCGLCKTGGKRVSHFTRFLLNYDFVLFCALRLLVSGEELKLSEGRCPYNPFSKKPMLEGESVEYTAAVFAVFTYYKLLDDKTDKKGFERIAPTLVFPLATRMKKRALKLYPELDEGIKNPFFELSELEKSQESRIDAVADKFGKMLAFASCLGLEGSRRRIAESCAYHIGRLVYIADAIDDVNEDKEKNNYNAILLAHGEDYRENIEPYIETLGDSAGEFLAALELTTRESGDSKMLFEILKNSATLGIGRVCSSLRKSVKNDRKEKNND